MTTFSINDPIFSHLKQTEGVNLFALQQLVDAANRNPELNSALSRAASFNDVILRVAAPREIELVKAGAFFDYSSLGQANENKMAIVIDASWVIGSSATLTTPSKDTRASILAVFSHEFDHYMRVPTLKDIDKLQDLAYRPELTAEQRFELYVTQRMQVEVQGWYAGLRAYRLAVAGSPSAKLDALSLLRLTAIERLLLDVEAQGRQRGLSGAALEAFVGEKGAAVFSRSSDYWARTVRAMAHISGINADAVRLRLSYRLDQPDDVVEWNVTGGNGEPEFVEIRYRNGERIEQTENPDLSGVSRRYDTSNQLTEVITTTINPDGTMARLTVDGGGNMLRQQTIQSFDDGSFNINEQDQFGNTRYSVFDSDRVEVSRAWTNIDGSRGHSTFDGGLETRFTSDGGGNEQTEHYDGERLLDRTWQASDGSHGTVTFEASGGTFGETHMPDGSSQRFSSDGQGNLDTKFYAPWGTLLSRTWTSSDLNSGREVYDGAKVQGVITYADGSRRTYSDDGKGNFFSRVFDVSGDLRITNWRQADGSHGSETVGANNQLSGFRVSPDGHYIRYTSDGQGETSSTSYGPDGKFISSEWTGADGSSGGTLTDRTGALVVFTNHGVHGENGRVIERYETNGVVRRGVNNGDRTQLRVVDDGEGTRIETLWGPDGVGIVENREIRYNPDGSGTITTTDSQGRTTRSEFGPGGIPRLERPDTPPDGLLPPDQEPEPIEVSPPTGDPRDNESVDDATTDPSTGYGEEIVHDDDGQSRDEDGIEEVESGFGGSAKIPSPIILDLDGDGVETAGSTAGAYFDHASDGMAEQTGWVGKDDGLLVCDINGNGEIDNGTELFGSETLLGNGAKAANGFDALAEFDQNKDGKIDVSDARFGELRIWRDANGNSVTDVGELVSLFAAGVQAINVGYTNTLTTDVNGNQHKQIGSYVTTDGSMRAAEDVWFQVNTIYTKPTTTVAVPVSVAALPNVAGFGKVYDLHQAMVRDQTGALKNLVTQFTQAGNSVERQALMNSIIYQWAGVQNVDPNSRAATQIYGNAIGDARKLEALEEFMGREWFGIWCWGTQDPNPHGQAAPVLLKAFDQLSEMIYCQLTVQTTLKPLFEKISYTWDATTQSTKADLWRVADEIASAITANRTSGKELLSEFMRCLNGIKLTGQADLVAFSRLLTPLGPDVASLVYSAWAVVGTQGSDRLDGGAGGDMLQGLGGDDVLSGNGGDDILDGNNGNDVIHGGAGVDLIYGGTGSDQLYGGTGIDEYYFGRGDGTDTIHEDYVDDTIINIGDLTPEELVLRRSGADLVLSFQTSVNDSIVLAEFFKNGEPQSTLVLRNRDGSVRRLDATALIQATLVASESADALYGTSLGDTISALGGDDLVFGRGGNDAIDGGAGADNLKGGGGDDQLSGGSDDDTLYGEAEHDQLNGGDGNDRLFGGTGNDRLLGAAGNDMLDGSDGADEMLGGAGNDSYLVNDVSDVVIEAADEGEDSISSLVALTLSANVENATLIGAEALDITGNEAANNLTGNGAANVLRGMAGDDHLDGAADNDRLEGGDGADSILGGEGDDIVRGDNGDDRLYGQAGIDDLFGGGGADLLEGNDGNDRLVGDSGDDLLDGGAGADVMLGGQGDDTYIVDDLGDVTTEVTVEGVDTVNSSVTAILSSNIENLLLVGIDHIDGVGNQAANVIFGNDADNYLQGLDGDDELLGGAGNDQLDGGAGNDLLDGMDGIDRLIGGLGDDVYNVDHADDVILESATEGEDAIYADVSYTLSDNIENLVLTDTAGYGSATGNALANHLTGNQFHNRLDGGGGQDVLVGGDGHDVYVVDSAGDQIVETAAGGDDAVESSISYLMADFLEHMFLTGSADLDATGNDGDNAIRGNAGNNVLDGGLGADWLAGGDGNDTYIVDEAGDGVYENGIESIDTIIRSFDTTLILERNVENLTLAGTVYRGNGNDLDNVITGNDVANNLLGLEGNDTLIGGGGADALFGSEGQDTLVGGSGDDYYEIDDVGDTIVENIGEGDDFVRSTVSWTLGANVERLALDGTDDLSVTGNALGNGLWGNNGNNLLTGGQGNDYVVGGAGNDVYVFNAGDGQDTIDNLDALAATDTLRFGAGIGENDVSAFQSGNSIFFKIRGSSDQIAIANYYAANTTTNGVTQDRKIDRIEFANGVVWNQAMIQTVVDRANNNHAPTVNSSLPTLKASQGSLFTYVVPLNTITDQDVWDSVTYTAKMANGDPLPSWLSFDSQTRTFSGTPTSANVGNLQFVLWGTDNYGYAAGTYVNLTVSPPNRAPVLATALADQSVAEGTAINYTVPTGSFTDPDAGDSLSYTATLSDGSALPSWLSFNASTRKFTGTVPIGALNSLSVRVTATDLGGLAVQDVFNITVTVQNLTLNGTTSAETLTGRSGNDTLTGNAGNDTLIGNAGNDRLVGGTGNDTMNGGAGDDTYVVDSTSDVVNENASEGVDTVESSVTWTLGANVERLTLTGTTAINGTGNTLDNVLTGNSAVNTLTGSAGNDKLDGLVGADTMKGGSGDDTYYIDNASDVVAELASEGVDTVFSTLTHTLAANVENLRLNATGAINGTGNTLDNILYAGSGNNTLNGLGGTDTASYLYAGAAVTVSLASTSAQATGGSGSDTLQNIENLAGSAFNDTFTGSATANLLDGGAGNDALTGGAGSDTYLMGRGQGSDTITESDSTAGNTDVLLFGADIAIDQLWFRQAGNDLEVSVIGGTDKATVRDWYSGAAYHVEQFKTHGGQILLDSKVHALVDAMAAFAPPAAGQTTLPESYQSSLSSVIAANWQ